MRKVILINLPVRPQVSLPAPPAPALPTQPPVASPNTLNETTQWFIDGPNRGVGFPERTNNDVIPYIDYDRYYAAAAELMNAASDGAVVIVAGWALQLDTPVFLAGKGSTIGAVLAGVGERGGQVRVLLSGHLSNPNEGAIDWLNSIAGCAAIRDDRLRLAGSFHQKAVVVTAPKLVAFVGGMDFGSDRLARPADRKGPWHDVQMRITGLAAGDVYQTLIDRWNSWPANKNRPIRRARMPMGSGTGGPRRSVQVVRTYGNPRTGTPLTALRPTNSTLSIARTLSQLSETEFSFAPTGESGIHDLLVQAIRNTSSSIYVEDQYFLASAQIGGYDELLGALAGTLAKATFKHLLVLTCGVGTIQGELRQVNQRRRALWQRVAANNPGRMSVWAYKGNQERCYWMHSKLWVFDDTFAIVGSANFNRRGLSHDGELAVGIYDVQNRNRGVVRELRKSLWLKHLPALNRPVRSEDVDDFENGRRFWIDTPDDKTSLLSRLDLQVDDAYHPDSLLLCSDAKKPSSAAQIAQTIMCFHAARFGIPVNNYDAQWNHLLDPDGT